MEVLPSKSNLRPVIRVNNEKCVACHRCISVCPVKFCNNASAEVVEVNPDLCIGCGSCIEACTHDARVGLDDFAEFQAALAGREPIVAIVAPAIAANFPTTYLRINGWLKSVGVKAVFDVSFGAELTVKSYLDAIKKNNPQCVIAQPCPALVTFIEVYHPELLAHLAPADSPMLHTMRMVREYYPQYRRAKFVVLSPCLAKRREFDEVGIGDFNVTYRSLEAHLRAEGTDLGAFPAIDYDNPPAERAVLFSTPGGLMRTAQREVPEIVSRTRKIEGLGAVYHYLTHLHESISRGECPLLVDCLSCEMGCNAGPGTLNRGKPVDEIEQRIEKRNQDAQKSYRNRWFWAKRRAAARLKSYVDRHWKAGLYARAYVDRSQAFKNLRKPTDAEVQAIYRQTHKTAPGDVLNCCSCGYNSCHDMATAIFNGLNVPQNCRQYKESVLKREKGQMQELHAAIAAAVNSVVGKMDQSMASLNGVSQATQEMTATISEIAANSEKARSTSDGATQQAEAICAVIHRLSDATSAIGTITETISDVSEQTKLLALNATIEAARAGESGKGFAVVASEVKGLAKQTETATAEIRSRIEAIQAATKSAVVDINAISAVIRAVGQLVATNAAAIEEQSVVTRQIAESISQSLASVRDVNELMSQTAASSRAITDQAGAEATSLPCCSMA
jgi:iron only hydrogenase large subunit-like protein